MRGGGQEYTETIKYFDDKSLVKYSEEITKQYLKDIDKDSIVLNKILRTYKKIIGKKVVELRIDTVFDVKQRNI